MNPGVRNKKLGLAHIKPRTAPPPPPIEGAVWIALTNNAFALIDAGDEPLVASWLWSLSAGRACGRVNGRVVLMHRLIMGDPQGAEVDHVNLNTLDNRRSNLRVATSAENKRNRRVRLDSRTGLKGVALKADTGRYQAYIRENGKKRSLGCFDTPEEAHEAYKAAARVAHGPFFRP